MIFLSLLIAGALVGVFATRVGPRRGSDPLTVVSVCSATAFVAGGIWVGTFDPAARATDPRALGVGSGAALIATAVPNPVSTPYRRFPRSKKIGRAGGIRRIGPARGVDSSCSHRRQSGARHRAPDASSPLPTI